MEGIQSLLIYKLYEFYYLIRVTKSALCTRALSQYHMASILPRTGIFIKYNTLYLYMDLTVILEPQEEGGYTVYVPSLPGCVSEGDTKEEALANIKEAIELYLESEANELVDFTGEQERVTV